ncbi:6-bladed beta-propeller [bacterium]|nr:6-bladed beta-propeller [bacterium]
MKRKINLFFVIAIYFGFIQYTTILYGKNNNHWNGKRGKELFSHIFVKKNKINLDYGENILFSIFGIAIDNRNNIIITDTYGKQVVVFSADGKIEKVIAKEGKGPGEVLMPTVVTIGDSGKIYLVDHVMRRISIFSSDYKFKDSFIFKTRHQQPFCISKVKDYIFMSGANVLISDYDPEKDIVFRKEPLFINKYDCNGNYLKSFFPIGKKYSNTIISSDDCFFYICNDSIYAVQEHLYKIHVFDLNGKLYRSFGEKPSYFKQVKRKDILSEKRKLTKEEGALFRISYSKIVSILAFDNFIILQSSIPLKAVDDEYDFNKGEYRIDIYNIGGKLLISGVSSGIFEMRCTDKDNNIYFVEYKDFGDESRPPKYIIGKYRLNTELLKKIEKGL